MNKQTPFEAPVVDELSVRVVVDSHYDRFLPKAEHPVVKIEHISQVPGRQMTTLAGEWGLSLHLESKKAGASARYLLDFGYTPEILNRNFDLLGLETGKLSGLILSHGHRDHYGGLQGFVSQHRNHMTDDMSLYVGAEDAFREKWIKGHLPGHEDRPPEPISWGALDRTALTAQLIAPVCCGHPHVLDGPFTSGYIERNSFETITGGTMVPDDHFTEDERSGKLVKDIHPEEHATCYIVKGRGLVVISSCGHTGIVNSVKTAMAVSGVDKLHAVIGGFHLGTAPDEYITHTIDELEALNPDVVVPMHCTGSRFIQAFRERIPEKIVYSNLGSRFTFGM